MAKNASGGETDLLAKALRRVFKEEVETSEDGDRARENDERSAPPSEDTK